MRKLEADLLTKGYSAYRLPNGETKTEIRLLVGAFWTEEDAETVAKDLQKEGFKPEIVRR